MKLTIKVDADATLRSFGIYLKNLKNMRGIFGEIAKDFATAEGTVFRNQGRTAGFEKWAPLNPDYAARKKAEGYGSKILIRTGALKSSLTNTSDPGFFIKSTPRSMEIGTRAPYAKFLHNGAEYMPPRSPIRIGARRKKKWGNMILRHLVNTKQLGFERL